MKLPRFLRDARNDAELYQRLSGSSLKSTWIANVFINPSLRFVMLARVTGRARGLKFVLLRNLLIALHASDVSAGAVLAPGIYAPHPHGIVIGKGVRIASGCWIFQNVTLGWDGVTGYPDVKPDARIYSNACVVGAVEVAPNSRVRAMSVVTASPRDSS